MEEQPAVENNDTCVQKLQKFYINNFPSDKQTCNLTLVVISMVLSSLNFIVLTYNIPYVNILLGYGLIFVFTVITCEVNYLFYQGLLSDDHKQISWWFVVKSAEIIAIVLELLFFDGWRSFCQRLPLTIMYPTCTALTILMIVCIAKKVKQMKKKNHNNISLLSEHVQPLVSKEKEEKKTEFTQLRV